MLRRIPAVKWAFTRLRPLPDSGSIDAAPIAASNPPAVVTDVAEAAPALDTAISAAPQLGEAEIAVATPVAEDDTVTAESPSATPTDVDVGDHPTLEMPADVEPVAVEEAAVSAIGSEPVDAPEVIGNDSPTELLVNAEPVVAEEAVVASVEVEPVEVPEPVISSPAFESRVDIEPVVAKQAPVSSADVATVSADSTVVDDDASHGLPADVELAVVDAPCVALSDSKISAEDIAESSAGGDPSPSVAVKIEPVLADDSAPVTAIGAADSSTDAPSVVTDVAPEPVLVSSAPEIPNARKPRSKVAEPVDRAALIRQRWAETGIRMWNPRLHGTGDATLNIQGSIGLLPPAPGETMPRYDKLEFRMLGGQIVCEGVILEAPAQTGHRSFTRLAEPRNPDRTSGSMRERQAALA
ncbi:hypothetical protein JQ607_35875 [Bradyrhizobium liaoningense]|uniref:hypothetical protein n=1 Tax=Bradyrhizobium liaoningense TaxID=43992 RepID=UPI001BAB34CA|nr:hypothetical protein [Bradyrhizobium liaoningense]MBR0845599.1 hypothetical protein [Bradyrhizobium liaoningense]